MLKRNWKFHAMVVAGIAIGVGIAFFASGVFAPPPPPKVVTVSPYQIVITEASWGLNCAKEIKKRLNDLRSEQRSLSGEASEEIQKKIDQIGAVPERNNALPLLNQLCGGRDRCELSFSENSLPYESTFYCRYELSISFMCHKFDIIRDAHMEFGDSLTIDCSDPDSLDRSLKGSVIEQAY